MFDAVQGLEKPLGGLALLGGGIGGEWEVMLAVVRLRVQVEWSGPALSLVDQWGQFPLSRGVNSGKAWRRLAP